MKSVTAAVLSVIAITFTPAFAAEMPFAQTGQAIESAGHSGDEQGLAKLQQQLLDASKQGDASKYTFYYLGYADYTLAGLYSDSDASKATDYLHGAEDALNKAVQLDAGFAEAYALLAGSYNFEIGLHPYKGMWLGGKAAALLAKATKLSPGNPRVLMLQAISDYSTPASFGGDKQRALQEYTAALAGFDSFKAADADAPAWGRAETYVWRGDAEVGMKDAEAATKDYQAALALVPDYKLASKDLARLSQNATAGNNKAAK